MRRRRKGKEKTGERTHFRRTVNKRVYVEEEEKGKEKTRENQAQDKVSRGTA